MKIEGGAIHYSEIAALAMPCGIWRAFDTAT
jgi:hypothetical protein